MGKIHHLPFNTSRVTAIMLTAPFSPPRAVQSGRVWLRVLLAVALMALALLAAMAWRTWQVRGSVAAVEPKPGVPVDAQAAARRLSAAVQLRTLWTPTDEHAAEFDALHQQLQQDYVAAHKALKRQTFGKHALLYTWPGRNPKAQPIALMAHQDVVPVAPGTEAQWQWPPFSGAVEGGFVWGRGAWDNKGSLMAIMEAAELLAASGFQPEQTIYFAFGADEEVGGEDGAQRMASALRQQGVKLRFVLDEGMLITHGLVPGMQQPVALIGMAEKGYMTLKLTVRGQPGHSSMPPPRSAVGILSEAVARVEVHPMPARLQGLTRQTFEAVAPQATGVTQWVLSNLWLTAPLLESQLQKIPSANAMVRSTGVATVFNAGERENVLPGVASALINFRLLPGDTRAAVLKHVQTTLNGLAVEIEQMPQGTEASAVSRTDSPAYAALVRTLRELQPGLVVAPGLLLGGTDSRHYADLSDATYRFSPMHATGPDLARFHGTNERISITNHVEMIQFYERLIRQASALELAGTVAKGSEAH